jgi:hypothetical protein
VNTDDAGIGIEKRCKLQDSGETPEVLYPLEPEDLQGLKLTTAGKSRAFGII